MNDMRFLRQQDVVDAEKLANLNLTLIGLGSIGSITGLALSKMGVVGFTAYDADFVEAHNWSNQMYSDDDIGSLKTTAFRRLLESYGGRTPNTVSARFENQPLTEVVVSAVDSMKSREVIWKSVRDQPQVQLYLDARMGLETLIVHAVRPQIKADRVAYTSTIVPDHHAVQEPCTARTICYTPLMAGSVICSLVKRYACDEMIPARIVLDLATFTMMS